MNKAVQVKRLKVFPACIAPFYLNEVQSLFSIYYYLLYYLFLVYIKHLHTFDIRPFGIWLFENKLTKAGITEDR